MPQLLEDIAEFRSHIGAMMDENQMLHRERSFEYKCFADTTALNVKRLERTGAIPAGSFRVHGSIAEQRVRDMQIETQRRLRELEQICRFQQELIHLLKEANNGASIRSCWKQLRSLWSAFAYQVGWRKQGVWPGEILW